MIRRRAARRLSSPILADAVESAPASESHGWPTPRQYGWRTPRTADRPVKPLRWREIISLVLLVALCDATIYRGHGFAGYAALFLAAPLLLLLGSPRPRRRAGFWIVAGMLLLLAARMIWLGSVLGAAAGFFLLVAFALTIAGRRPYVLDVVLCATQTTVAGFSALGDYRRSAHRLDAKIPWIAALGVLLPLAAIAVFGTLFILANPDLSDVVADALSRFFRAVWDCIADFVPSPPELIFWIVAAWVSIGLLRPILRRSVLTPFLKRRPTSHAVAAAPSELSFYPALRNTLAAVIALFAVYLVFEYKTLWFREFPKGFYYGGYAHEGAAWLTAALALATVVLSLMFRGRTLRDSRLPRLRRLAWIWSAENLVLVIAVFNRLHIYIDFNGMTRMRTVAIFGILAVVAGFVLVVWKILANRDFVWLVRRQLWALAIVTYLYTLTPVDALVHSYNVRKVLGGDLAPSVQIAVHPIDAEGVLVLRPLTECDDAIIRNGVRALLAQRADEAEMLARRCEQQGWNAVPVV